MENNLIESESKFGLYLEGESSIEATLLSSLINNIAELTKYAAKEENPEAYLKMNVTAFRNGSFNIDFYAVCAGVATLLINNDQLIPLANNVIQIVKGFFEIKRFLKGEKAKSVKEAGEDKIEIENRDGIVNVFKKSSGAIINNYQIDNVVINIADAAYKHNPNGGFTLKTEEGDFKCLPEEKKYLSSSLPFSEETTCLRQRVETKLPIKKADFTGHSKWDFIYDGHIIQAKIDDEEWTDKVNNGEVSVRAGDYLKVLLEAIVDIDLFGKPIPYSEQYTVLKVHGGIQHDYHEQTTLE